MPTEFHQLHMISKRKRRAQDSGSPSHSYKQRRFSQSPEGMSFSPLQTLMNMIFVSTSTLPLSSSSGTSSEREISIKRSASLSSERTQYQRTTGGRSLSCNNTRVPSDSPHDPEHPGSQSTPKLLDTLFSSTISMIVSEDEIGEILRIRQDKRDEREVDEDLRNLDASPKTLEKYQEECDECEVAYYLSKNDNSHPNHARSSSHSPSTESTIQPKPEERQRSCVENIQPRSSFRSSQANASSKGSSVQPKRPPRKSLYPRTKPHIDHKKFKAEVTERNRQAIKMRSHQVISHYQTLVNPRFELARPMSLENYHILLHLVVEKSPSSVARLQSPKISRAYYESELSMKRTIDKAKATLNSPKPSVPFTASLEQRRILDRKKDAEIEKLLQTLPDRLPKNEEEDVENILRKRGVVAKFAREQVSDVDISRLYPCQWLNDEILNFYGAMILARSESNKENAQAVGKRGGNNLLDVHYFSSFFWDKLIKEGYERGRLAKWTKKINLFSKDVVLIPVNHSNAHWTAAAINFRQKRIESYDSMGMARHVVFTNLRAYLDAEHRDKKKEPFDFTGWEDIAPEDTPQQDNGWDCGVFTCHFLEALSRGVERFAFAQRDMPYLRRRMIWEIGNARLRDNYK